MKSKRAREAAEPEGNHVDPVEVDAPSKKRKRTGDEDSVDLKKAKKDKKEKKDKKDKKDKKHKKESRKERKEKRKDLQDLPEQDDDEEVDEKATPATNGGVAEDSPMADAASQPAAAPADAAESEKSAKRDKKKEKKEKKEKKLKGELQDTDVAANGETENPPSTGDKKKKNKKDKKPAQDDSTTAHTDANAEADGDANAETKNDRHIVFVGNLPFTATAATIEAHFSSLSPASVRCMSDPNSDKPCRGFAFVEFSKVWHMRTCLDKFHHSMFNDGVSPPRRINVELTAGGGGKTKKRKDKIIEKNRKLDENRTKRIEREKNAKEENRANGNSTTAQQQHMEDSIHPSRRARVPGEY